MKKKVEEQIIEVLDTLRPFIIGDGGNIEYIKYENHNVYIRMTGTCANCEILDFTLKEGIEMALKEEIPEIEEVIAI